MIFSQWWAHFIFHLFTKRESSKLGIRLQWQQKQQCAFNLKWNICIVWYNQPFNFVAFNFVYYLIESRNGFETINEFQMKYYSHSIRYFSLVWYHEWSRHQDESSIFGKISNWIFFFGNDRTMNQGICRVWDGCSQIMANWSRIK